MPATKPEASLNHSFALRDPANLEELHFPDFPEGEPDGDAVGWEAQIAHARTLRAWGKSNPDSLTHPPMNPEPFRFVSDSD